MKKEEFDAVMDFVFCEHDRPSPAVRQKWWYLFGEVDRNLVMAAAKQLRTYGQPKAADLQKALDDIRLLVATADGKDAESSWGLVLEAVARFGSYRMCEALSYLEDQDPATATAVRAVGWKTICMSDQTDSAIRAHYWKVRHSVQKRTEARKQLQGPHGDSLRDLLSGLGDKLDMNNLLTTGHPAPLIATQKFS